MVGVGTSSGGAALHETGEMAGLNTAVSAALWPDTGLYTIIIIDSGATSLDWSISYQSHNLPAAAFSPRGVHCAVRTGFCEFGRDCGRLAG